MWNIEIVNKNLGYSKYVDVILGRDEKFKLNNGKWILVVFFERVGTTTIGNIYT
jgi:hypothetical protein